MKTPDEWDEHFKDALEGPFNFEGLKAFLADYRELWQAKKILRRNPK